MTKKNEEIDKDLETKKEDIVNEGAGTKGTQPDVAKDTKEGEQVEKTYTPTEYQDGINKAIASKLPSKERMQKLKDFEDSQKTEAEKQDQQRKEHEGLKTKSTLLERENKILKRGLTEEDADYVLYKVGKLEGEFDDNLNTYLEANPKFLSKETTKTTTTGYKQTSVTPKSDKESYLDDKYGKSAYYKKK